jgi:drug/metabolite transporter (DMT)-like permease
VTVARSKTGEAAALSIAAAILWAAYYPLVLGVPNGAAPSGILAWPFLVAGVAFSLAALRQGHGTVLRRLWVDPRAWLRVALIVVMQASVLASTYLAGAVDTSLLSLLGDVVLTPIFLALLYREGQERTRSGAFVGGVTACTAGAVLTIVATGAVRPLSGLAWAIAPLTAVAIALYFLLTARANRSLPANAVLGQLSLAGGLIALIASPIEPGGVSGILPPSPIAALALLAIGVVCFYVAPACYFAAIERAGMILPAVLMATIPVFTLLLSWVVLGVVPPPFGLLGIPIAVVGAIVALRGEHEPWTPSYAGPDRAIGTSK